MPKAFPSRFDGSCVLCGGPIRGKYGNPPSPNPDLIVWNRSVKGQVAHEHCYIANDSRFPNAPTTTKNSPISLEIDQTIIDELFEVSKPMPTQEPKEQKHSITDPLASMIADAILPVIEERFQPKQSETPLDEAMIVSLIQKHAVRRIEVVTPNNPKPIDMGIQHFKFESLLQKMNARTNGNRLNFWVWGPAGTGKTTAVENIGKALGYGPDKIAVLPKMNETYSFFGYRNPGTGEYIRTMARDIWDNGGLIVFDDFDGTDPNAATELNAPFSNGLCMFPDGMARRHPDCCIAVTANTFGHGGTEDYVGRLKQDKAFLNRFVKVFWPIDEQLERSTVGNDKWVTRVQTIRAKVAAKGIKVLITPRQSYYGAALLNAGVPWNEVEECVLKGEMTEAQWSQVNA